MSRPKSLRSRLLLGSLLWTAGLLFVAQVAAVVLFHTIFDDPIRVSRQLFRTTGAGLILAAVLLMVAGFFQVRRGLSALDRLGARLAAVRDGSESRLEGRYPAEVQPLVNVLNDLLDQRERAVERALAKAGDLAHGLKTPLAVLTQTAERAADAGHPILAAEMLEQLDRMRRQIDYQLAHARAASAGAGPGTRSAVRTSAEGLLRTLERLHADRTLALDLGVAPEHWVRCRREDVDEMLGNLLENAFQWARSRLAVASAQADGRVEIRVEDDGPGLAPELREAVLRRGVRADETAPGSGLGLAIVRDLAELYGGSIALDASPLGGLRARLVLPAV